MRKILYGTIAALSFLMAGTHIDNGEFYGWLIAFFGWSIAAVLVLDN